MTKPQYRTPPVSPNAHLTQLAALKDVDEKELTEFQLILRKSLLSLRSLKALRKMHIREMAIAGYEPEQIRLAFAAPDSPLGVLISGFKGQSGMDEFRNEIKKAIVECDDLDAVGNDLDLAWQHVRLCTSGRSPIPRGVYWSSACACVLILRALK